MDIYILIGVSGLITGFISGLLGIGGGIIMAPLLLYAPTLFGLAPLTMHTVAGLTIVQGLVACVVGGLTHKKFKFYSGELVLWMGVTLFITSFLGGIASYVASGELLMLIFAGMALTASALMFLPGKPQVEHPEVIQFTFCRFRAVAVSGAVGFLGGLVGQGGSFILIPLMISYIKVPVRIAIGSNLAIVFLATFAAFLGKTVTGQIEWLLAVPIVLTVIPGAYLGANMSRKVSVTKLRLILAICIGIAAVRISISAAGY